MPLKQFSCWCQQSSWCNGYQSDTTMSGLISNEDENMYRQGVDMMVSWCVLNVSKTKEIVVDFRANKTPILPLQIDNQDVEQVQSFQFLGSTISNDLTWSAHTHLSCRKAQQRLYFLRQLKKNQGILIQFYRSVMESVLTFSCTVWYNSATQEDRDNLQRIVKTAGKIIGCVVFYLMIKLRITLDSIFT